MKAPSVSQNVSQNRKASKGTVVVQNFKGRLRLVWSYAGKRYYHYLGLPDGKVNRIVAEGKAKLIEGDIVTGNFDSTLEKYKPESQRQPSLKVSDLIDRFLQHKAKHIHPRTLEKYQILVGHCSKFFQVKAAKDVNQDDAERFKTNLQTQMAMATVKECVWLVKACWEWAMHQKLLMDNPWLDTLKRIKVPPKQQVRPFTKEEIQKILQGFREDTHYSHYADFVEFLMGTGCRIGEAAGLRWQHLNEDCSQAWIGESLSRGYRKQTKTNRARTVNLTKRLQKILLARRREERQPDELVFTAPQGGSIDDHNFRNRPWKLVLEKLGVEYRRPYNTRHTRISHALDAGMTPAAIADQTGHSVEILLRNHAGNVQNRPRLPELLEEDAETRARRTTNSIRVNTRNAKVSKNISPAMRS